MLHLVGSGSVSRIVTREALLPGQAKPSPLEPVYSVDSSWLQYPSYCRYIPPVRLTGRIACQFWVLWKAVYVCKGAQKVRRLKKETPLKHRRFSVQKSKDISCYETKCNSRSVTATLPLVFPVFPYVCCRKKEFRIGVNIVSVFDDLLYPNSHSEYKSESGFSYKKNIEI